MIRPRRGLVEGRREQRNAWAAWVVVALCVVGGCTSSALPTAKAVNICQCRADEVCVLEQCVPLGQTELMDAASGGADAGADALDIGDGVGPACEGVGARIAELRHGAGEIGPFDFVELEGDLGASLAGWRLIATDESGAQRVNIVLSGALSEGVVDGEGEGRWFAGWGAPVEGQRADVWVGGLGLPSPVGRVTLLDCRGEQRDAVAYGLWPTEAGVSAAEPTAAGESLGRCPGDAATGDAAKDFVVSAAPTPGEENETLRGARACVPCEGWAGEGVEVWLSEVGIPSAEDAATGYLEVQLAPIDTAPSVVGWERWSPALGAWRGGEEGLSGTVGEDGVLLVDMSGVALDAQRDAVRVVGCRRKVLDAVGYGEAGVEAGLEAEQVLDAATPGQAFSRCPADPSATTRTWSSGLAGSPGVRNACP